MQRVTNCFLQQNDQLLMLKKPSYDWWNAPGGKMEPGESVYDSVRREFREETGLALERPHLRGIFTFITMENGLTANEWMMFTFEAFGAGGRLLNESPEGILEWKEKQKVSSLPMAEGDKAIVEHILNNKGTVYGTFRYTKDRRLLESEFEQSTPYYT